MLEHDVVEPFQIRSGDRKGGFAGVDHVQPGDPRRDHGGPPPAPAANVRAAAAARRQVVPREDAEVVLEDSLAFGVTQAGLIEARPLVAERLDDAGLEPRHAGTVRARIFHFGPRSAAQPRTIHGRVDEILIHTF